MKKQRTSAGNIPVALITGGARRIGASIAQTLHASGFNIVLHYRSSAAEAEELVAALNRQRPESAICVQTDLLLTAQLPGLITRAVEVWGRLDALINNASSFYPTPVGDIDETAWDDLIGSNLKAPLFLSQAAVPHLKTSGGGIVNIVDVHAERPMRKYVVYSAAKAGLALLTKSLARELAPEVRVNGVAPGSILWPEHEMPQEDRASILQRIPLQRAGTAEDIALAVKFLLLEAPYITGHILPVDGGRSLYI
ncbi:MAG TPA: pteridine reductase [Gammaproteobacteria bacterium]|nr:pteridine reductase [Gammaproteobacteria bacterium]